VPHAGASHRSKNKEPKFLRVGYRQLRVCKNALVARADKVIE
jgi:hypothetical protein